MPGTFLLLVEAAADARERTLVSALGAGLAAHRGELAPSTGGCLVAAFPRAADALACADELRLHVDPPSPRVVLHDARGGAETARAAARVGELPAGALFVSDAFQEALPGGLRRRFGRRSLGDGALTGWLAADHALEPASPAAVEPWIELRDAVRGWAEGWRQRPRAGPSPVGRLVRSAIDAVERSLTPAPADDEFVRSLAALGRPASAAELADLHHVTRSKARKLAARAVHRGEVRRLSDGTYLVLDPIERENLRKERQNGAFRGHLTAYGIVNGGLILINAATTGGDPFWAAFPVIGWGIGLAFHARAYFSFLRRHRARMTKLLAEAPRPPRPRLEAALLGEPWRGLALSCDELLGEIDRALPEGGSERALFDEFADTARALAEQGGRLDHLLGRFDRACLEEDLAQARAALEGSGGSAASRVERVHLLEKQAEMLGALTRRREGMLLELRNLRTTLENLGLELSQRAIGAPEDRAQALLERGAREVAQFRDLAEEARAEVERLLRQ